MDLLLVLLSRYESTGEAIFVGAMQGLLVFGVIAIVRAIKGNKKDWEDIDKNDKK